MKSDNEITDNRLQRTPQLLWYVLALATTLRLWGLTDFSLSNDELSALARLQYGSVADVIKFGVFPDFHPAGVQLFLYYWTTVFGFSEWMVRIPFALMGMASVYFIYRIGSYWFNASTGLLAAAALAVLQFPLLYSQIARPYSPGLLFSLLATYFWTRSLFDQQEYENRSKKYMLNYLGFTLAVSACMYTHYFSFIFAGILCLTGLFFLRTKTLIPYLLSGVAIVLLYLPHLQIFLHQLSKGGVGGAEGWLGPPGEDAFGRYLDYCFNDSPQLKLLFFIITAGTILLYRSTLKLNRFHLLSILFFALPFIIAYYYSIWRNPVFQHSVLLFSFPYLLILLFSFIPENSGNLTGRILLFSVLIGGFYSTVYEKKYYTTPHFTEFRGIANRVKELDEKFGASNITKVMSIFSPYYIQYYMDKINHPGNFAMTSVMTKEERLNFRKLVGESKTSYFLYAWSNVYDEPILDFIVRSEYPWILLRDSMLNSGLRFYSREQSDSALNRLPVFSLHYGFENGEWENENGLRDSAVKYEGNYSIRITPLNEYSSGFSKKLNKLGVTPGAKVEISTVVLSDTLIRGAKLVMSVERDQKSIQWFSSPVSDFYDTPGKWSRTFLAGTIPAGISGDEELKIYIWNEQKELFHADDFRINIYSDR